MTMWFGTHFQEHVHQRTSGATWMPAKSRLVILLAVFSSWRPRIREAERSVVIAAELDSIEPVRQD